MRARQACTAADSVCALKRVMVVRGLRAYQRLSTNTTLDPIGALALSRYCRWPR